MGLQIEDGLGSGRNTGVTMDNRLLVSSVSIPAGDSRTLAGGGFNLNTTATIAYTTTTESGVCFIQNAGLLPIVIESTAHSIGVSTGAVPGTPGIFRYYRNTTTGTLVSGGVAITPVNRNFASSKTLTGTFLRGTGAALTVTNGVQFLATHQAANTRLDLDVGFFVLSPGNSFAATYQPPALNTSQQVMFAARIHEVAM